MIVYENSDLPNDNQGTPLGNLNSFDGGTPLGDKINTAVRWMYELGMARAEIHHEGVNYHVER